MLNSNISACLASLWVGYTTLGWTRAAGRGAGRAVFFALWSRGASFFTRREGELSSKVSLGPRVGERAAGGLGRLCAEEGGRGEPEEPHPRAEASGGGAGPTRPDSAGPAGRLGRRERRPWGLAGLAGAVAPARPPGGGGGGLGPTGQAAPRGLSTPDSTNAPAQQIFCRGGAEPAGRRPLYLGPPRAGGIAHQAHHGAALGEGECPL